jgi:hypothetical protein
MPVPVVFVLCALSKADLFSRHVWNLKLRRDVLGRVFKDRGGEHGGGIGGFILFTAVLVFLMVGIRRKFSSCCTFFIAVTAFQLFLVSSNSPIWPSQDFIASKAHSQQLA